MRIHFCAFIGVLLVITTLGFSQDTNFPTGPQYLATFGSPEFARSISTPTMALPNPVLQTGASNATSNLIAGADNQTPAPYHPARPDLFPIFYGPIPLASMPSASTIEISAPSETPALPNSIVDLGVWQIGSAQFLQEYEYDGTLAEAAAANKARAQAIHVYTNADIDRLRGGK